jgi:hypothetical protein
VDDAAGVGVRERGDDAAQRARQGQRLEPGQRQAAAAHVLEHEQRTLGPVLEVEHRDDRGVPQRGHDPRLAPEARAELRAGLAQDLERHQAAGGALARQVHGPHPARADHAQHAVAPGRAGPRGLGTL